MLDSIERDPMLDPGIAAVFGDPRFPEACHRLQRGVHLGPEDGMLSAFVDDNFRPLRDFLALWGGELVRSVDHYFHLVPGDRYHGHQQLARHEMLVGQTLARLHTDPAMLGRKASVEEVAMRIERACGSEESYLRVMVNRKRAPTVTVQRDRALEMVAKALRRLGDLGFCDLEDDQFSGLSASPRAAAMRFVEMAKEAGGDEDALRREVGRRKSVAVPRTDNETEADGDDA